MHMDYLVYVLPSPLHDSTMCIIYINVIRVFLKNTVVIKHNANSVVVPLNICVREKEKVKHKP